MTDINKVVLTGRLTRDADLKYLSTGTAVAEFSVANNQYAGRERNDTVHFFNCTMFGRGAEALSQYLLKGLQVTIDGVLQQQRWEDKKTGQPRTAVKIKVDSIVLGQRPKGSSGEYSQANSVTDRSGEESQIHPQEFEDDIPF
jgi:single-strand DNA-binding protein